MLIKSYSYKSISGESALLPIYCRMAGSSKYPDRYIKAFRDDYYRHGKYNLEVQAPHLASLADHYKRKYLKTKDWRDCLKVKTFIKIIGLVKAIQCCNILFRINLLSQLSNLTRK